MTPQMVQVPGEYGSICTIGEINIGAIGTPLGMQRDSRSLRNLKPTSVLDLIVDSSGTTPASLSCRKSSIND
ncbi:unnamed protein product [Diabrotica balteata]|uniref:Uncharacterized protein n=1 Tax=Diabrotica balteata TaxID=107213 RepID=A0A9N9SZE4_DIABA|nr:unnamed protein product [Diabrotica balteata]